MGKTEKRSRLDQSGLRYTNLAAILILLYSPCVSGSFLDAHGLFSFVTELKYHGIEYKYILISNEHGGVDHDRRVYVQFSRADFMPDPVFPDGTALHCVHHH